MFDELKCEYPLPLPANQGELAGRDWSDHWLQTKDFDCTLDHYRIDRDGVLWRKANRRASPGTDSADWELFPCYTGKCRFYEFEQGKAEDYWIEWSATLVRGELTEVSLLVWEPRDNRERLAQEAEWAREQEAGASFLASRFGSRVYPPYAWLVHGLFEGLFRTILQHSGDWLHRSAWALGRAGHRLAPHGDPIRQAKRVRKWNLKLTE
jgi:hypothetical protein